MRHISSIGPLLWLCGCNPVTSDTGAADPWSDLTPASLDPLRELARVEAEAAVQPTHLAVLEDRALSFLLDPEGGCVHVVDARYHHTETPWCLDVSAWSHLEVDAEAQGFCAEGEAQIQRGLWEIDSQPLALAVDPEGLEVWVVDADGRLYRAPADAVDDSPIEFLRLRFADQALAVEADLSPHRALVLGEELWLLAGDALVIHDLETGEGRREPLEAEGLRIAAARDGVWVATGAGATHLEEGADPVSVDLSADPGGLATHPDDPGAWVSLPSLEELVYVTAEGIDPDSRLGVEGITGPVAWDAAAGRLYLGVDEGLAVLDPASGETTRHTLDAPLAIHVTDGHEIRVLHEGGVLTAYGDETALEGGNPLQVAILTFLERPRNDDGTWSCWSGTSDEESLQSFVARAVANRAVLDDLPAPAGLGIVPALAQSLRTCGLEAVAAPLWEADRTEPGVLFHGDRDPHQDVESWMDEGLAHLEALDISPTWVSGLSPQYDEGVDWVETLAGHGALPQRYLFFGLSVLPDIPHDDPRAKDAWPVSLPAAPLTWRAGGVEEVAERPAEGAVTFFPGENVPGYDLGACPNLFLYECHILGQGGNATFSEADVTALDLLLFRALAYRKGDLQGDSQEDRPATWSFHLPDLGAYDYTEQCTRTSRTWTGSDCEAALLQEWLLEVHRRYALSGLLAWTLPSEMEAP